MKKSSLLLLALLAVMPGLRAADSFVRQLTPEERKAAGLDQLTAEQQAALDELAARYAKEGSRVAVAEAKEQVRAAAKEEARAEVEHEVRKREESRIGLESKGTPDAIKSKLVGTFKGWSGRTLFVLENGQQWVQADPSDSYWVSPQPGPAIEIRQSGIGGWKLFLVPNGRWVRVKRVN